MSLIERGLEMILYPKLVNGKRISKWIEKFIYIFIWLNKSVLLDYEKLNNALFTSSLS